jgi:hypothetical protein
MIHCVLGCLAAFYVLAPLPYQITTVKRHGWQSLFHCGGWNPDWRWWWGISYFLYFWKLEFPYYYANWTRWERRWYWSWDFGPWYRVTFRWWWANYQVWKERV